MFAEGICSGKRSCYVEAITKRRPRVDTEMDQDEQRLSEQFLTALKEWQRAHPKATFRQIEDEVHHAAEYLSAIGEAVRAGGRRLPSRRLDRVRRHEPPSRSITTKTGRW
jgi:hypothetical protein